MTKTFLLNVSLKHLQGILKKENELKAEKRQMTYILRKQGVTIQDIADDIDRSYGTIHN